MSTPTDPLLALIRRVRTRFVLADAGWMFVMTAFVVAVALVVASFTLRLVPIWIGPATSAISMAAALIVIVPIGVTRRWPSKARVARRIDSALELHELLASALASPGDDAAARSVRAAAIAAARRIKPGDVPTTMPSANAFVVAFLMLGAAITASALNRPSADEETAREPTPPHRTPAGLMDHDTAGAAPTRAEPPRVVPESGTSPMPDDSHAATTTAATSGEPAGAQATDAGGRAGGESDPSPRAPADLSFGATGSGASVTAASEGNLGATGGASNEAKPEAGPVSATDMRAGASSPRVPDRGRSGSQDSQDASRPKDGPSSPVAAVARVPDRHRALVRAYFDASATRPSDASR